MGYEHRSHTVAPGHFSSWYSPSRNGSRGENRALNLPRDATELVAAHILVDWINEPSAGCSPTSDATTTALINVLVYAYATGVFDCYEIVTRCDSDPHCRHLCNGVRPFPDELVRLRRRYRQRITEKLADLLARLSRHQDSVADRTGDLQIRQRCRDQAADRLNSARHFESCLDC